jgi:hypothetical protein
MNMEDTGKLQALSGADATPRADDEATGFTNHSRGLRAHL